MPRLIFCFLICLVFGCGNGALSPEDEFLSQVMALTNLGKTELRNTEGALVGINVSVDVINTGPVLIEEPFILTWRLRFANGDVLALAKHRFGERSFGVGERRRVHLVLTFAPRMDLDGIQDAATFEFESTESSAAMAGAGVLTMSSGPPCSTWTYMRHERLLKG